MASRQSIRGLNIDNSYHVRGSLDSSVASLAALHSTRGRTMARKARKKRGRRRRREALVDAHLENVSRDLLERHPDVVRNFIGRNAGVYALYRRNRLYYVGLARALRHRLKAHIKNRHGDSWDSFSVYLTIKDQHIREIEALM